MANKKKIHKRCTLSKRLKSRKRARKRRAIRKKLKKDISNVADMFKSIDIDPVEDILERLLIDKKSNATAVK